MVSGQVPLSFLGGAAIVASTVEGADTVYLARGINTLYWRLFSIPDVKTLDDLRGKKIGLTTMGSQEDAVMRFLLRERASIRTGTSASWWSVPPRLVSRPSARESFSPLSSSLLKTLPRRS
jgi:hypothetical protein